jgi:hypothetical protein
MKAKIAARFILAYSVFLFVASVWGALHNGNFSIFTVPVSGLLFIGPAMGIYRRINWCRIFLGIWFALMFVFVATLPLKSNFLVRPIYFAYLLGSGVPVYLLFLYAPLKAYTRAVPQPPSGQQ